MSSGFIFGAFLSLLFLTYIVFGSLSLKDLASLVDTRNSELLIPIYIYFGLSILSTAVLCLNPFLADGIPSYRSSRPQFALFGIFNITWGLSRGCMYLFFFRRFVSTFKSTVYAPSPSFIKKFYVVLVLYTLFSMTGSYTNLGVVLADILLNLWLGFQFSTRLVRCGTIRLTVTDDPIEYDWESPMLRIATRVMVLSIVAAISSAIVHLIWFVDELIGIQEYGFRFKLFYVTSVFGLCDIAMNFCSMVLSFVVYAKWYEKFGCVKLDPFARWMFDKVLNCDGCCCFCGWENNTMKLTVQSVTSQSTIHVEEN